MILLFYASIMSDAESHSHSVAARRAARGWSQVEPARRAGIPRSSVSAIESERLTPSVAAALGVARALECSVEELFGGTIVPQASGPEWAWQPRSGPCRYWEAQVGGRRWLYPVESLALNATAHDGVWREMDRRKETRRRRIPRAGGVDQEMTR